MHLACRNGGYHNAVKLVLPRTAWRGFRRSFAAAPSRFNIENPDLLPPGVLGSYIPNERPNVRAQHIAIVGGGITGLATAFWLTKDVPFAKVTIYETKARSGGWIDSERVEVNDGSALFEWGPRTIRPDTTGNGLATLQLVNALGRDITSSLLTIDRTASAAVNRFIYYPDHLVRMPARDPRQSIFSVLLSNAYSVFTEPIYKGLLPSLFAEPTVACRPMNVRDESVGDFIKRRLGTTLTDNLLSALFHGIYAGDIYKLSVRTLFPYFWYLENRDPDGNGIIAEMAELVFRNMTIAPFDKVQFLHRFTNEMKSSEAFHMLLLPHMRQQSVYTFQEGIGQLTDVMLKKLQENPNVNIVLDAGVEGISFEPTNRKVRVTTSKDDSVTAFDYAVCTLSPRALARLCSQAQKDEPKTTALVKHLETGCPPSVNVMVVNLYYREQSLPYPPGFGYLIPRSIPADQNPERALGVIFSSETAGPRGKDAIQTMKTWLPREGVEMPEDGVKTYPSTPEGQAQMEQDLHLVEETRQVGQDTASGTKLAVMLGGHWWDGWAESDLPSEEEAIQMAKRVIARHLKIDNEPYVAKARMQRNCIPQYQVGYRDGMMRVHRELVKDYEGRLKVAGVWWQGGVGVNDCVRSARETSRRIREAWDDQTGLERYEGNEKWVLIDQRTGKQMMDPMQK